VGPEEIEKMGPPEALSVKVLPDTEIRPGTVEDGWLE